MAEWNSHPDGGAWLPKLRKLQTGTKDSLVALRLETGPVPPGLTQPQSVQVGMTSAHARRLAEELLSAADKAGE